MLMINDDIYSSDKDEHESEMVIYFCTGVKQQPGYSKPVEGSDNNNKKFINIYIYYNLQRKREREKER